MEIGFYDSTPPQLAFSTWQIQNKYLTEKTNIWLPGGEGGGMG